mmetsp:Transcript_30062/g.89317  ORF Transcript_30062/g.89317 Transcript_30062/m.89317 type:complete len:213 (-) Transcript_30062:1502-2140(-)
MRSAVAACLAWRSACLAWSSLLWPSSSPSAAECATFRSPIASPWASQAETRPRMSSRRALVWASSRSCASADCVRALCAEASCSTAAVCLAWAASPPARRQACCAWASRTPSRSLACRSEVFTSEATRSASSTWRPSEAALPWRSSSRSSLCLPSAAPSDFSRSSTRSCSEACRSCAALSAVSSLRCPSWAALCASVSRACPSAESPRAFSR